MSEDQDKRIGNLEKEVAALRAGLRVAFVAIGVTLALIALAFSLTGCSTPWL